MILLDDSPIHCTSDLLKETKLARVSKFKIADNGASQMCDICEKSTLEQGNLG